MSLPETKPPGQACTLVQCRGRHGCTHSSAVATTIVVAAAIITFFFVGAANNAATPSGNVSPPHSGTTTTPAPTIAQLDAGTPSRLKIDKIGIDAPELALGTAPDGSQEVPTTLTDTAWWRDGSHPGTSGNAVIAGDAAHALTDDGVFDKLGTLKNGDQFQILAEGELSTIP